MNKVNLIVEHLEKELKLVKDRSGDGYEHEKYIYMKDGKQDFIEELLYHIKSKIL